MAKLTWLEPGVWNEAVKTRWRICVSMEMLQTKGLAEEKSLRRPEKIVSRTQQAAWSSIQMKGYILFELEGVYKLGPDEGRGVIQ